MTQTDALVVLIACPTGEPADTLARTASWKPGSPPA